MDQAVAALDDAIDVLETAAPASLLVRHSAISKGQARRSLEEVLQLGRRTLAVADVNFLERLLAGDVPQRDWKKLNRKATFKLKYNSQTGHIIATLKDLR